MTPLSALPAQQFGCILADPPWRFKTYSAKGEGKSPQSHYDCMDIEQMAGWDIARLAKPDCALVMWATFPMIQAALDLMAAWGFEYKTGGAWAKQSKTGKKWHFGTGYIVRNASEPFLIGTRGKPKVQSHSVRNLIAAPVREHSRKPDQMHHMCEAIYEGEYLELFARQQRPSWTCWGNEVGKFEEAGCESQ